MRLFRFFSKKQPESAAGSDEFYSRAEHESAATRSRTKRGDASSKRQKVDAALPEKKRARRRLVGAVALVLALVIGLPMVLDSEPKPLTNELSIQIPSKNTVLPASTERLAPPHTVAPDAPASSNSAGLDAAEEIVQSTTSTGAAALSKKIPDDAKDGVKDKPAVHQTVPEVALIKPEKKLEPKPEPKTEKPVAKDVPHPVVAEKSNDSARAKAILEGNFDVASAHKPATTKSSESKPAESKSGKFVLQVAALASADKVSELRGKLSDAGIQSYTQKIATASGERIRIRVGPFASKDDAEKVRAKLGKIGLNGTLIPT